MRSSLEITMDMTDHDLDPVPAEDCFEVDDIASLDMLNTPAIGEQPGTPPGSARKQSSADLSLEIELSSEDMNALLGNDAEIASVDAKLR